VWGVVGRGVIEAGCQIRYLGVGWSVLCTDGVRRDEVSVVKSMRSSHMQKDTKNKI
jgi:hypothetical protein